MKQKRLSRRTILRGLGSVTIGLPLLEEKLHTLRLLAQSMAQKPAPPISAGGGVGSIYSEGCHAVGGAVPGLVLPNVGPPSFQP